MELKKGTRVEVCSSEEGFLGAWFEGFLVNVSRNGRRCSFQYDKFVTEDGKPLVEDFSVSQIRPIPPGTPLPICWVGDAVEAYDMDCWWRGIVIKPLTPKFFLIYFPDTRTQKAYHRSSLRLGQEWINGKWSFTLQDRSQNIEEFQTVTLPNGCQSHTRCEEMHSINTSLC